MTAITMSTQTTSSQAFPWQTSWKTVEHRWYGMHTNRHGWPKEMKGVKKLEKQMTRGESRSKTVDGVECIVWKDRGLSVSSTTSLPHSTVHGSEMQQRQFPIVCTLPRERQTIQHLHGRSRCVWLQKKNLIQQPQKQKVVTTAILLSATFCTKKVFKTSAHHEEVRPEDLRASFIQC